VTKLWLNFISAGKVFMSTLLATTDWELEAEQGPDWLFVRLHAPLHDEGSGGHLAEEICHMMQQQFTRRVVLELNEIVKLNHSLIEELLDLQQRVCDQGGTLRVCGLSDHLQEVLGTYPLIQRFCIYHNREEAIMGRHACHSNCPPPHAMPTKLESEWLGCGN
jgi:anti-anti-sigma regulatory factor